MAEIGVWSSIGRRGEESARMYWVRRRKTGKSLSRSGIAYPEAVSLRRALSGMKLRNPSLCVLLGALGSQRVGNSVPAIRRLSAKLLEARVTERPEDVTKSETIDGKGAPDSGDGDLAGGVGEELYGCFSGADGRVYEMRKSRPTKTRRKRGSTDSARKHARVAAKRNNRSAENHRQEALQDGAAARNPNGCIRCWADGHTWRRCNFPPQRQLDFRDKNGPFPPMASAGYILITAAEDDTPEKSKDRPMGEDCENVAKAEKAINEKEERVAERE